jgi:hypothetical protein
LSVQVGLMLGCSGADAERNLFFLRRAPEKKGWDGVR